VIEVDIDGRREPIKNGFIGDKNGRVIIYLFTICDVFDPGAAHMSRHL
jgi:hypothetical protein